MVESWQMTKWLKWRKKRKKIFLWLYSKGDEWVHVWILAKQPKLETPTCNLVHFCNVNPKKTKKTTTFKPWSRPNKWIKTPLPLSDSSRVHLNYEFTTDLEQTIISHWRPPSLHTKTFLAQLLYACVYHFLMCSESVITGWIVLVLMQGWDTVEGIIKHYKHTFNCTHQLYHALMC